MRAKIVNARRFGAYAHLVLTAPQIARRARPGQFVMVRAEGEGAPFLRRPFSICRARANTVELLIKAVGPGSRLIASQPAGASLDVVGPLGTGFTLTGKSPRLLIGGGFGVAPLLFLAESLQARGVDAEVLIGGRCEEDLLLRRELKMAGARVACATEDGSHGTHGLVTDLLEARLENRTRPCRMAAAGPWALLRAVAGLAQRRKAPAEVSLEEMMACGLGVCNGCVIKVKNHYLRVCKEGPVFRAEDVAWEKN